MSPDGRIWHERRVRRQVSFCREYCTLGIAHFANLAGNDFDTTGRATCIAAATMKNVNSVVFQTKHEFATRFAIEYNSSFSCFSSYLSHLVNYSVKFPIGLKILIFHNYERIASVTVEII